MRTLLKILSFPGAIRDFYISRGKFLRGVMLIFGVMLLMSVTYTGCRAVVYMQTNALTLDTLVDENSVVAVKIRDYDGLTALIKRSRWGEFFENESSGEAIEKLLRNQGAPSLNEIEKLFVQNKRVITTLFGKEALIQWSSHPSLNKNPVSRSPYFKTLCIAKMGFLETLLAPLLRIGYSFLGIRSETYEDIFMYSAKVAGNMLYFTFDGSRLFVSNSKDFIANIMSPKIVTPPGFDNESYIQIFAKPHLFKTKLTYDMYRLLRYSKDIMVPEYNKQDPKGIVVKINPGNTSRFEIAYSMNTSQKTHDTTRLRELINQLPGSAFYAQGSGTGIDMLWEWLKKELPYNIEDPETRKNLETGFALLDGQLSDIPKNVFPHLKNGFLIVGSNETARRHSYVGRFGNLSIIFPVDEPETAFASLDSELRNFIKNGFEKPLPEIRSTIHNNIQINYIYQQEFHEITGLQEIIVPAYTRYNDLLIVSANLNHLRGIISSLDGSSQQTVGSGYMYQDLTTFAATVGFPAPKGASSFGIVDPSQLYTGFSDYTAVIVETIIDPVEVRKEVYNEARRKDPTINDFNDPRLNDKVLEKVEQKKNRAIRELNSYIVPLQFFYWGWFYSTVEKGKVTVDFYLKLR